MKQEPCMHVRLQINSPLQYQLFVHVIASILLCHFYYQPLQLPANWQHAHNQVFLKAITTLHLHVHCSNNSLATYVKFITLHAASSLLNEHFASSKAAHANACHATGCYTYKNHTNSNLPKSASKINYHKYQLRIQQLNLPNTMLSQTYLSQIPGHN